MELKTNDEIKELCLALAKSDSEEAIMELLFDYNLWDNSSNWRDYGDNENNFSTIGNQQKDADAALVEKIINSVDAVLMAECLRREINPESDQAPESIFSALKEYFNIEEGKLTNVSSTARSKLSDNIQLITTGIKGKNPCYTVIDKGEGQTPLKMPLTLLSLTKSNKLRIPFVQGKFNMGGTGVLQFCGTQNLQLIISKRHPEIAINEIDKSKDKWGFTIVRRENPGKGVRNSTFRYLAPNGNILCFSSDSLSLLPGDYPEAYKNPMYWGTFIKMFEYQMIGYKTLITLDPYYRLSLLLPEIALPVKLVERRRGYKGHTFETILSGLSVRLNEDRQNNIEVGFPDSGEFSIYGQKFNYSIYAFKKDKERNYKRNEGIIFTVNGQTHARLTKDFYGRNSVGMQYLENSILTLVDCSEIDGRTREDLFMNSRDRLRGGDLTNEIENMLTGIIKDHQGLRELRSRRREEEFVDKVKEDKPLIEVIERIMKKSPTLSKLFIEGLRLPNPFNTVITGNPIEFKGKHFPTKFELIHSYPEDSPRICPINHGFKVQFTTDAVNDYFNRSNDKGFFKLFSSNYDSIDYSINLWNGIGTLNIKLPYGVNIGEILHFESYVTDDSRSDQFYNDFFVCVGEAVLYRKGTPGKVNKQPFDKSGKDQHKIKKLDVPNVREVRRADWSDVDFNEESALKVVDSGENGYDFYINMDNKFLLTEKKNLKTDPILQDSRFKYGMVLIGMAFLSQHLNNKKVDQPQPEISVETKIFEATQAIAPFLLPMITQLGEEIQ